jgi:outer membrane protein assembly factor BamB
MIRLDKKWLIFVVLMLVAQVLFAPLACAADWPMFGHDPAHTGVAGESVEPPLELLWKFGTGWHIDHSSPAISGDTLYIGSLDNCVYALDATTGSEKWKFETGGIVHSSPAVCGNTVYTGSWDNHVYALDATTGSEKWKFKTGGIVHSSPALHGNTVYIGSGDGYVYAIDSVTGADRWKYATGDSVSSSPAIYDNTVYIGSCDGYVYALDATTGTKRWRYKQHISSSPVVSEGMVYIGAGDGMYALDALTGEEKWKYGTSGSVSSPAVSGGTIYVGVYIIPVNGYVCALDANTGEEKWKCEARTIEGYSSPAVSGNTIYVDYAAGIYALDATTGEEKWKYATGGGWSSPAVSGGVVYVGSSDCCVYAFAPTTATPNPTPAPTSTQTTTPTPTTGSISVSSAPSGADIYLDGAYKGTTPATISDASPGAHTLKLEKYGYAEWLTSVHVTSRVTESITAHLTAADVSPPAIRIDKPTIIEYNNNELLEEGEKVEITYGANDPSGVTSIKITLDGITLSLTVGEHTIRVEATDSKSNRGFEELLITVERTGPSVYFGTTRTTIEKGEDAIFTLSAVNPIGNPPMTIQLILKPPTGVSVTSSSFAKAGSGIYTCTQAIESGDNVRSIEVRLTGNEVGTHEIESEVYYQFRGSPKSPIRYETLTLIVEQDTLSADSESEVREIVVPGFGVMVAIMGLLAVYLRRKRR